MSFSQSYRPSSPSRSLSYALDDLNISSNSWKNFSDPVLRFKSRYSPNLRAALGASDRIQQRVERVIEKKSPRTFVSVKINILTYFCNKTLKWWFHVVCSQKISYEYSATVENLWTFQVIILSFLWGIDRLCGSNHQNIPRFRPVSTINLSAMVQNREESFHGLLCTQPLKYAEYFTHNVCLLCYKIHKNTFWNWISFTFFSLKTLIMTV